MAPCVRPLACLAQRCLFVGGTPTFDEDPSIHIDLSVQHNAHIDILTLSHWVDVQYFEQNKLVNQCSSLHEWLDSKSPTHILLDICPNRLDFIYKYNVHNSKPEELSTEQINEILDKLNDDDIDGDHDVDGEALDVHNGQSRLNADKIREHFYKLRKQTKKMKRFQEKIERLDDIHKLQLITSANKVSANQVLKEMKLTEPVFTEVDIWLFEFYWSLFEKYFKNLVPYFDEFKREFYLNTIKFRFLNIIYGEEIGQTLQYFDPEQSITNYNEVNKYKYKFPKLKAVHSRNRFDEFMEEHETLSAVYHSNSAACTLIAGGMPIEFIYRKLQKIKKPMMWIEFAMAIKNYFADRHAQNLANQIPLLCDIREFIWTPYARKIQYNSWDSTIQLNEMLHAVTPLFYDIFVTQQSEYLFQNLLKILHDGDRNEAKNIVILTGQGIAHAFNQRIYQELLSNTQSAKLTKLATCN